jgi:hypothetical protein
MNLTGITSALAKLSAIGSALKVLFPIIVSAIQEVESALGAGNGATKLQAVLGIVETAYGAVQGVEATWADIQPAITGTVNALVTAFNAIKSFAHAGQPAA